MGADTSATRPLLGTRFLLLGVVASTLLAVPTVVLPLLELVRVEHASLEIADDSQAATQDLGAVGQQLARLRFHALIPDTRELVTVIEHRLHTAVDELTTRLGGPARWRWMASVGEVERLEEIYERAATLVESGDTARAEALLKAETPATTRLFDTLDEIAQLHQRSVLERQRSAHAEATRIGITELVLAGVFLIGLVTIWTVVIRILRRQGRRLIEYTARLENANADLDAFAGRVAHDLKNALGPVTMAPAMLRESAGDTTAVLRIADRTERSARRAVAVVDSLLAFSRASRRVEAEEAGALVPAVKAVLDELAPLIAQLDVTVEVEELPDVRIRCNPGLLHIVLANLCGNAVKFLVDRAERRVHIAARLDGEGCEIDVEDSGPGIPTEARDKIFEPFFRIPGGRAPGTGIGLATVRRIVDARGGRIEVASELGRGSRFRVWLPLAPPEEQALPRPQPEARVARP